MEGSKEPREDLIKKGNKKATLTHTPLCARFREGREGTPILKEFRVAPLFGGALSVFSHSTAFEVLTECIKKLNLCNLETAFLFPCDVMG